MPLESATYVDDLVSTNPLGTDDASLGDDHIRLIKSVLKNTFPNLDGALTTKLAALNGVSQLITVGSDGKTLTFNFPSGGTVGNVTDWTSNQPVPASQADGRYVQFLDDNLNWPVQYVGVNRTTSQCWFKSGPNYYMLQTAGSYALASDLSAEVSNRTNADTHLQNQINNRVLKSGDTMTGTLTQNLGTSAAVVASGLSGPVTSGQNLWTPQFVSAATNDGSLKAAFCARDYVGNFPYLSLQLTEQNGTWHELQFRNDNRLYTASGNKFALTSEVPSLPFQTLKSWTLTHVNSMTTFQLPQTYKTPPLMWCQDVSSVDVHYACIRNVTTMDYLIQTSSNDWIPELQVFCLGDPA